MTSARKLIAALGATLALSCTKKPALEMDASAVDGAAVTVAVAAIDSGVDAAVVPDVWGPLPPAIGDAVLGCWQVSDTDERWRFARTSKLTVEVTRELSKAVAERNSGYAKRARLPQAVDYSAPTGKLAFLAAGPIHGLLFTFKREGDTLVADTFSSRIPGTPYHATGTHLTLVKCSS